VTILNVQKVSKFFHWHSRKFATKRSLQIPTHLKGFATLPCGILVFKNCTNRKQRQIRRVQNEENITSRWAGSHTKPTRPATIILRSTYQIAQCGVVRIMFFTVIFWSVKRYAYDKQEAQLPLRNRASATYFFVAKLISIAHSCLKSPQEPTSNYMANLLRTAHTLQHTMLWRAWRATPLSFEVAFLGNPCEYPHNLYIARN